MAESHLILICRDVSSSGGRVPAESGEGEIRTHDTLSSIPHFECGAFDHSATSPLFTGHDARSTTLPRLHLHLESQIRASSP